MEYASCSVPNAHSVLWARGGFGLDDKRVCCLHCGDVPATACAWVCCGCHRPLCDSCEPKHAKKGCLVSIAERVYGDDLPETYSDDAIASVISEEQFGQRRVTKKAGGGVPTVPQQYTVTTKDFAITFRVCGLLSAGRVRRDAFLDGERRENIATVRTASAFTQRADGYGDPVDNLLTEAECNALRSTEWPRIAAAFDLPTRALNAPLPVVFQALYETTPTNDKYFAAYHFLRRT